MVCFKNIQQNETIQASYSKMKDLLSMIYTQLEEFRGKEDELLKIDGKAVIMLTGDKGGNVQTGGNFMKFAYNIMKICMTFTILSKLPIRIPIAD